MITDNVSTVAANSNDPHILAFIPEEAKDDDAPTGEKLEIGKKETTETSI